MGLAMVLFAGAIPNSGFVADDAFNLAEHANHGDWSGEWTTPTYAHAGGERGHIWRPIPAWIQHIAASLLGRTGETFRSLNLAVHLLNIGLFWTVARRLGASVSATTLLALLWTTHPAMPEAICWSSDIYDLMATSFALLAVAAVTLIDRNARIVATFAMVVAACLSKESAIALIPALGAVAWALGGRTKAVETSATGSLAALTYTQIHGVITGQNYSDAVRSTPIMDAIDAALMNVGWWTHPPTRAPMAHLFDRAGDQPEILIGAVTLTGISLLVAHQVRNGTRSRFLIAGLIAALGMIAPAAIGIPYIGVAPLRYAYAPLALGLVIAAGRWNGVIRPAWGLGIALVSTMGAIRVADRVPAFDSDAALWAAERAKEPENPYAAVNLARAWVGEGKSDDAIALWTSALNQAPQGVRVFNLPNERWQLAQTAFLRGQPDVALKQVLELMNTSAANVPPMAHCLHADSLDALGRHEEANIAAQRCNP